MSEVKSVKWSTVAGDERPQYVEITLASGRKIRYYPK